MIFLAFVPSCNIYLFADDTKCYLPVKSSSDQDLLQDCINSLSDWSTKWSMPFNESKCVVMYFAKRNKLILPTTYNIGGIPLTTSNPHKDLGILLQGNLMCTDHHNYICSIAYKILGLLKRCFSTSNSCDTKRKLYISLVTSQLSYCSQIWRPVLIKDIKKIEGVQRRATKFIVRINMDSSNKTTSAPINVPL